MSVFALHLLPPLRPARLAAFQFYSVFPDSMSGFPGRSFRRRENRNLVRCSNDRTISSGFVSLPRIRAITADRFSGGQMSMFGTAQRYFLRPVIALISDSSCSRPEMISPKSGMFPKIISCIDS